MDGGLTIVMVGVAVDQRGEVEGLLYDLGDEAGEMFRRGQFIEVGREEYVLLRVVGSEVRGALLGGGHATRNGAPGFSTVGRR